ncbi:phosphatase PAP2 family protein [Rhodobacter maris]|uniref:PAP2 superfamily protein n=1 Tax=Rhodobacter maris TaxID=446682 RepID=A0A285RLA6_9RHOB|nr:phosphatase PAP2 family protein [Rhodobacter maris]SOB94870.1 PAP2 superfamily protein [Rhodobacter maris]
MRPLDHLRAAYWLTFGWLAAAILFRHFPGTDPAVTGLFYRPGAGFPIARIEALSLLREGLWNAALGVFVLSAIALVWTWRGRVLAGLGADRWGIIFWLFLLGPGVIVNLWLKNLSGRARPDQTTLFGGEATFSLPGDFTDQCARNCSFVSGEVAAATALALALFLLSAPWGERWSVARKALRLLALAIPVFVMLQRVGSGRHFASDAVFAVLITLTLAWALEIWRQIFARDD